GDMPPEMQTRLLRVLSDGQYYRVGGHQPLKAEARVIAATHQALEERVRLGLFREDLFHRLNVIRLRLPSLRERADDVALLARHFLQQSARELGAETKRLSRPALRALAEHPWPGNVRELGNLCRWLTLMVPSRVVELRDLPEAIREPGALSVEPNAPVGQEVTVDVDTPPPAAATGFVRTLPAVAASAGLNADEADGPSVPAHYGRVERAPDWQQLLAAEVAAQLASQSGSG